LALLAALLPVSAARPVSPPPAAQTVPAANKFYPGITEAQSMRAHDALRFFYNGNFRRAEKLLAEMDAIEDHDDLPPLSRLLQTAMAGLYLERDDAGSPEEEARLRAEVDSASSKGLRRCKERGAREGPAGSEGTADPPCLLIEGGVLGFRAILRLNIKSPLEVLDDGLTAVSRLDKALATDSTVRDAHLGLGIFNAVGASSSPRVARAVLRAAGRGVDLQAGLEHLRRSGYDGQYTSTASQFYLIRFLSPYDDELKREKLEIFRSLREVYPLSPLPLFLQGHEMLCFYPDSFYRPRARVALANRIRAADARDYAATRYLNLLKWQYSLLDADPPGHLIPDTTFDLGGYAFYPALVEAFRLRREITETPLPDPSRDARLKELEKMRKDVLAKLRKSTLSPRNREYYAWQVRDALEPKIFLKSREP
jgi:hypothetical protein